MKIFRISNILSFAAATAFGVLLFWTSSAVQQKEDQLFELQNTLVQEEEAARVLGVEWDYLNRPQRLEKMAVQHLGMELPSATEIIKKVNEIPEPVVIPLDETLAIPVAVQTPAPKKIIPMKAQMITPAKTDKQSFDRLIESLDEENGGAE